MSLVPPKEDYYPVSPKINIPVISEAEEVAERYRSLSQSKKNPQEHSKTVEFCWPYGGNKIYLSGSFNEWGRTPLNHIPHQCGASITLNLYPGTYEYKFIVDETWCYDVNKETKQDSNGNTNNVIIIE